MKKKKGYALVLVMVVTSLLLVLSAIVLSLSTTAYISTKRVEQNNRLKLAAESGVDKANLILRNYILKNSVVLLRPNEFNPDLLNKPDKYKYTVGGIEVIIEFSPNDALTLFPEVTTGRNIAYIQIKTTATDTRGNIKIVTAILDKNGINNIYFDRIFKGSFTTVGNLSSEVGFNIGNTDLTLTGNAFLQGQIVNLTPSKFNMASGEIKVKAGTFNCNPSIVPVNGVNLYKSDKNSLPKTGWKDVNVIEMKMLKVFSHIPSSPNYWKDADPLQDLDSATSNVKDYIITKPNPASTEANPLPPTLITYKGKSSGTINFQELVDGKDLLAANSGIFHAIYSKLSDYYPLLAGNEAGLYDMYGKFYKLIIIDGDLLIPDDGAENFNNYLIYCTGTVTFEGEAHFYNCSIFSKRMVFNETNKKVEFYGVNTDQAKLHKIGTLNLNDFSDTDKGIINNYLINNLESYGDYVEYKTLQWKE